MSTSESSGHQSPSVGWCLFEQVFEAEREALSANRPTEIVEVPNKPGVYDTIGLCLSGGGIRSAAFCLGAIQALAEKDLLKRIDYLSTVSGGGYVGSAFSTLLKRAPLSMPFKSGSDMRDSADIQRIRDYSNYLFPNGISDLLKNAAILIRGWIANILIILPVLFAAAALTIAFYPTRPTLDQPLIAGLSIFKGHFGLTMSLGLLLIAIFALWAILVSLKVAAKWLHLRQWFLSTARLSIIILAVVAFIELQPVMIQVFLDPNLASGAVVSGSSPDWLSKLLGQVIAWFGTIAAPLAAAVSLFARILGNFIKRAENETGVMASMKKGLGNSIVYIAALALPVLLWLIYLTLCTWGIKPPAQGTPSWVLWATSLAPSLFGKPPSVTAYAATAGIAVALSFLFSPNANSLHRLYRWRLNDAFLAKDSGAGAGEFSPDSTDRIKLSDLSSERPYQILNTALNIHASHEVNKRGRNADFFFFSKLYSGSSATGYVKTSDLESVDPELDLATAMAISGAAVSSNMGSESIRLLSPTLALLNLRLGYWMENPLKLGLRRRVPLKWYLFLEMFGWLSETSRYVYLTDGGHIENLGLYELLCRRCQLIIVVDAEADPSMNFSALVKVERYARIDLGIRIELPWEKIRAQSLAVKSGAGNASNGPHCAVGRIEYGKDVFGYLVYVKASLSGDENDYIRDYARRYPTFPHETTSDQFFNEEQFEAYRALGFHALHGFLCGKDRAETLSGEIRATANRPIRDINLREVYRLLF
jgi:hypothetical protein